MKRISNGTLVEVTGNSTHMTTYPSKGSKGYVMSYNVGCVPVPYSIDVAGIAFWVAAEDIEEIS